jgi:hypothetical protein
MGRSHRLAGQDGDPAKWLSVPSSLGMGRSLNQEIDKYCAHLLEAINTALVDRVRGLEERVSQLESSQRTARILVIGTSIVALISVLVVLAR